MEHQAHYSSGVAPGRRGCGWGHMRVLASVEPPLTSELAGVTDISHLQAIHCRSHEAGAAKADKLLRSAPPSSLRSMSMREHGVSLRCHVTDGTSPRALEAGAAAAGAVARAQDDSVATAGAAARALTRPARLLGAGGAAPGAAARALTRPARLLGSGTRVFPLLLLLLSGGGLPLLALPPLPPPLLSGGGLPPLLPSCCPIGADSPFGDGRRRDVVAEMGCGGAAAGAALGACAGSSTGASERWSKPPWSDAVLATAPIASNGPLAANGR